MESKMDSNTLKALRVVVNESTTKQIKELQKDSDELEKIKEELPLLALSDKDINNHQTGHYLEEINHLNFQHYLFQGMCPHGREDHFARIYSCKGHGEGG